MINKKINDKKNTAIEKYLTTTQYYKIRMRIRRGKYK